MVADAVTTLLVGPVIVAITNVNVAADSALGNGSDEPGWPARWERVLERLWAVIAIDSIISLLWPLGAGGAASGAGFGMLLLDALVLAFLATLFFADVYACVEPDRPALTLVPLAFARSTLLSWQNLPRVMVLLAAQLALALVVLEIDAATKASPAGLVDYWTSAAVFTLAAAPVAAWTTTIYLYCVARERETMR